MEAGPVQALVDDALIKLRRVVIARDPRFRRRGRNSVARTVTHVSFRLKMSYLFPSFARCRLLACVTDTTLAKAGQLGGARDVLRWMQAGQAFRREPFFPFDVLRSVGA